MARFEVDALERLDDCVGRFESAWRPGGVRDWSTFLPPTDAPDRLAVLTEVVRVDIELHSRAGSAPPLSEYFNRFPELHASRKAMAEISFEHFRAERLRNPKLSAKEYERTYGVETRGWETALSQLEEPTTSAAANHSTGVQNVELSHDPRKRTMDIAGMEPAAIRSGDQLGEFELIERLGRGSLADVFLASQPELSGRQVVLKVSSHKTSEPQKLSRLQHSNIVPIYSAHSQRGLQIICMPYLGRTTLADLMRNHGQEPSGRHRETSAADPSRREMACCALVGELAEGLAYAHQRGITHRDLKPANILIADDGTPMLLDFNLSGAFASSPLHPSYVGGTLPYMAPEQLGVLSGSRAMDPRSDLYALGVILYELLTGKLPFPTRTLDEPEAESRMREDRQREEWRESLAYYSPDMRSIVARCLVPDPAHRYQRADELCEDLALHGSHRPLRHAPRRSLGQRVRKWMTRNGRRAAIAASVTAAIAIAVAMLAFAWTRQARIERLEAVARLDHLRSRSTSVRMGLGFPLVPSDVREQLTESSCELLQEFSVETLADIEHSRQLGPLQPEEKEEARFLLSELLWRLESQAGKADTDTTHHRVLRHFPSPSYGKAMRAYRAKNFSDSERHWMAYLEEQPTDGVAWCLVGNTLWAQQRYLDAGDAFGRAAALEPRSPLPWFYRGVCWMLQERYALAEAEFTQVLKLRPDLRSALLNRAICRKQQGKWSDAIGDLDRVLARDASDLRGLLLRAECWAESGEAERAEEDRARALAIEPRDAEGFLARGDLLLDGDPQAAVREYRQAISLDANLQEAWQNLAHVYSDVLHQPDEALKVLSTMQAQFPRNPIPPAAVGVLSARMGDSKRARKALEKAQALSASGSTQYQLASGYALLAAAEPKFADAALEALRLALVADPAWLDVVIRDKDFTALHADKRFQKLLFSAQTMSHTVEPIGDSSGAPKVPEKSTP